MTRCADSLAVAVPPLIAAAARTSSARIFRSLHGFERSLKHRAHRLVRSASNVQVVTQRNRQQGIQADSQPLGVSIGLGLELIGKSCRCGHWGLFDFNVTPVWHQSEPCSLICFRCDKTLAFGSLMSVLVPRPGRVPLPDAAPAALRLGSPARQAALLACQACALAAQLRPWTASDGLITPPADERGMSWPRSQKALLRARAAAPKPAKTRPRVKHRAIRASLPLADQVHARAGTPCSVPAAYGVLSGVPTPAPAWDVPGHDRSATEPPSELYDGDHLSARQVAGALFLTQGPRRRWGWLIRPPDWLSRSPPYPKRLEQLIWNLKINTAYIAMKIELGLYYARMSLSMWITRRDTLVPIYKLSTLGSAPENGGSL